MTPDEIAAVKAEHEGHDGQWGGACLLRGFGVKRFDHCMTYRLAVEAERVAGQVSRVEVLAHELTLMGWSTSIYESAAEMGRIIYGALCEPQEVTP